jgi:hypothetical protein
MDKKIIGTGTVLVKKSIGNRRLLELGRANQQLTNFGVLFLTGSGSGDPNLFYLHTASVQCCKFLRKEVHFGVNCKHISQEEL